jgi:diphthine synthase
MNAHQAIEWLIEAERKWECGLITNETLICVASKVGSNDEKVFAGYPNDLLKKDIGSPLQTLVIPGNLHFMESYALVHLAGAPDTLIDESD